MNERDIIRLATSKLYDSKKHRDAIEPGTYEGDAVIRVTYKLKVGQDSTRRVVQSIPWQRLCLLLMGKLNEATLESVVRDALNAGIEPPAEVKARVDLAMARLTAPTNTTVHGSVTGSAEFELVSVAAEELQDAISKVA